MAVAQSDGRTKRPVQSEQSGGGLLYTQGVLYSVHAVGVVSHHVWQHDGMGLCLRQVERTAQYMADLVM
jgi:hypothetical protein